MVFGTYHIMRAKGTSWAGTSHHHQWCYPSIQVKFPPWLFQSMVQLFQVTVWNQTCLLHKVHMILQFYQTVTVVCWKRIFVHHQRHLWFGQWYFSPPNHALLHNFTCMNPVDPILHNGVVDCTDKNYRSTYSSEGAFYS